MNEKGQTQNDRRKGQIANMKYHVCVTHSSRPVRDGVAEVVGPADGQEHHGHPRPQVRVDEDY